MSALISNAVNLIRNQTTGAVQDISTEDVYTFTIAREDFYAWLQNEERRTSCTFYYRTTGNASIKNKDFSALRARFNLRIPSTALDLLCHPRIHPSLKELQCKLVRNVVVAVRRIVLG